ncbi:MAG: RNA polymerase sigma factor SigM [Anaerolineales bacterium]
MNEAQWIESARRGDEGAWTELVHIHQEPVFRLAYLMLGDPDEAADAAQETFIRASRALHRFDLSRPLRPWLFQIVANLARNRRRSIGRYWAALQRGFQKDLPAHLDVESRAGARLQAQRLWQAVRRLREEDQQMIYLRYFLDLPVQEAAQAAGVAEGTVKSRTSRAMSRLREVIQREFPDLEMEQKDDRIY